VGNPLDRSETPDEICETLFRLEHESQRPSFLEVGRRSLESRVLHLEMIGQSVKGTSTVGLLIVRDRIQKNLYGISRFAS
jgi:hypothetical protein